VSDWVPVKDEDLAEWDPITDVTRVSYLTTDEMDCYPVTCIRPTPPEDDWFSIAETFEFLPAGE